jgi:hypothetical protein
MKHLSTLTAILSVGLFFASCKKSADDNIEQIVQAGTILKTGFFVSNSKTTSGTVKIVRGTDNIIRLVFENLSTGNGPDVRVWLSPNTTANPYQEIGLLKAVTGTFSYELGSGIDYTTNNRVLIWCEDFAVLFGHAVLQ